MNEGRLIAMTNNPTTSGASYNENVSHHSPILFAGCGEGRDSAPPSPLGIQAFPVQWISHPLRNPSPPLDSLHLAGNLGKKRAGAGSPMTCFKSQAWSSEHSF